MPRKTTPARRAYTKKWIQEHRDIVKRYQHASNLKARGEPGSEQRVRYNADARIRNAKARGVPGTEKRAIDNAKRAERHARKMRSPEYRQQLNARRKARLERQRGAPGSPERELYNASVRIRRKQKILTAVEAIRAQAQAPKQAATAKGLVHKAGLKAFLAGRTTAPVKAAQAAPAPKYTGKLTPGGF